MKTLEVRLEIDLVVSNSLDQLRNYNVLSSDLDLVRVEWLCNFLIRIFTLFFKAAFIRLVKSVAWLTFSSCCKRNGHRIHTLRKIIGDPMVGYLQTAWQDPKSVLVYQLYQMEFYGLLLKEAH